LALLLSSGENCNVSANKTNGALPLTVQFSPEDSSSANDNDEVVYEWDFESDNVIDSRDQNPTFTFTQKKDYFTTLTVRLKRDPEVFSRTGITITAGNTPPQIDIEWPLDGGFFKFNDTIPYRILINDPDEPTIDQNEMTIEAGLGHSTHAHTAPLKTLVGTVKTASDSSHQETDDVYYVMTALYNDRGGERLSRLTTKKVIKLHDKRKQVEFADQRLGMVLEAVASGESGRDALTSIEQDNWFLFKTMNFHNIQSISARVASGGVGGRIEIRLGSPSGSKIGEIVAQPTGGWQSWRTVQIPIQNPGGTHDVYFVFKAPAGIQINQSDKLLNINWLEFNGAGITQR
jgi:cytochrome c